MTTSARLYAILARDSPRAVIFRRGPSRQVLLLGWDTETDALTEGQWLKGRIYERRCDLSPEGDFLVYFAASWRKPYETWTAVSRPPLAHRARPLAERRCLGRRRALPPAKHPRAHITGIKEENGPWWVTEHDIVSASGEMRSLGRSDWADWAHSGDLLFAKGGALYRLPCPHGKLAPEPRQIADLSGAKFTPREAPPEMQRWGPG